MEKFKKKRTLYIILVVLLMILAIIAGIIAGLIKYDDSTNKNTEIASTKNQSNGTYQIPKNEYLTKKNEIEKNEKNSSEENSLSNEYYDSKEDVYSEEYKEYLALPEEEKNNLEVIPRVNVIEYGELDKIIKKENKLIEEKEKEKEKDESKVEEKKDDSKIVEKKDENKVEDKKDESKVEDKKDESKVEEKKDESKVEDKKDESKVVEKKDESKVEDKKDENETTKIPAKFRLDEIIDIQVAKQKSYELCWDFASMKCVETNLALTQGKYYDFSEIHVDYLTSNLVLKTGREVHERGNFEYFMGYVKAFGGFVLEKDLPYRDYAQEEYSTFINMDKVDENVYEVIRFPSYYRTNNSGDEQDEKFKTFQNAMKRHIMNFGSLYVVTITPESNSNIYYADKNECKDIKRRHAMSIVGWDDNYSKDNFTSPTGKHPKNNGAYIVLNSWGKEKGDNGYFYISYEDYLAHCDINGVISTSNKDLIELNSINNPGLEKYIQEEYKDNIINNSGKQYINKILLDTSELDLSNRGLTSVNGIDLFENLVSLNLSNNSIQDVSDLEKLTKLEKLDLSNNEGVNGWQNLTTVYDLKLVNCKITDISALKKFGEKDKITIDLSKNQNISNIEIIKELNLGTLKLQNCKITDLNLILNNTVEELDLSGNKELSNFNGLNKFKSLTNLILQDCNIKNVENLNIPKQIKLLDLSYNKELKNIDTLKDVEDLRLKECGLNSTTGLEKLDKLNALDISYNNIQDITGLNNSNIEVLNVSGNITISGNLSESKIKYLDVSRCELDNNFNFFEIKTLDILIANENILDINKVLEKIKFNYIEIDNCDYSKINELQGDFSIRTNIHQTIKVPRGNLRVYIKDLFKGTYSSAVCEGAYINDVYGYINLNAQKNGEIILKGVYNSENHISNSNLIIRYEIDNTIKPIAIAVTKLPYKISYINNEQLNSDGMEISEKYEGGFLKQTNKYSIKPQKNEFAYGLNEIGISQNSLNCIYHVYVTNNFELHFKSNRIYNIVREFLTSRSIYSNEIISYDDKMQTIQITNDCVDLLKENGVFQWNVDMIQEMVIDKETLKYFDFNKITLKCDKGIVTKEDIEKILSIYPNLKELYINNQTDKDNEDIVKKVDGIKITVYKNNIITEI